MRLVVLGDSMSSDDFPGKDQGAGSQLANRLMPDAFQNMARDGWTTREVLGDLHNIEGTPDVITLTVGGNDALELMRRGHAPTRLEGWDAEIATIFTHIREILDKLAPYRALVILNTIYDPSDGDEVAFYITGLPPGWLAGLKTFNASMREFAKELVSAGWLVLLCDVEALFRGHGHYSHDPWIKDFIEPNLQGATSLAKAWSTIVQIHQAAVAWPSAGQAAKNAQRLAELEREHGEVQFNLTAARERGEPISVLEQRLDELGREIAAWVELDRLQG